LEIFKRGGDAFNPKNYSLQTRTTEEETLLRHKISQ